MTESGALQHEPFVHWLHAFLRGIGQVYLQRSAWTGTLLLAAVALQSYEWAAACALSTLAGSAWGYAFGDRNAWRDGLYGYNGALSGIGVLWLINPGPFAWTLVVIAGIITASIVILWQKASRFPVYTAPFVAVTWLLIALAAWLSWPNATPTAPLEAPAQTDALFGVLRGAGQVMLLDNPVSGALCLLALLLSSRKAATTALWATLLGWGIALLLGFPSDLQTLGIYGFNAVLTAEALRTRGRWWLPTLGIILSTVLTRGLQLEGIPTLTAPFVLCTWLLVLGAARLQPHAH
ncbi:MAG TPA: urea transporter [Castellaniella sp.]|uniref:urea transporter n=1 Tax=Castellaniella sp. TaxID=1955812 RepID=UPI002F1B233A